jgi:GNAT superfamily N-acetyltransferase
MNVNIDMNIRVIKLDENKINEAAALALEVFLQYEAPDYSQEGILTFRCFLEDRNSLCMLEWFGAYADKNLIGIIATRNSGSHISLFFVSEKWQGHGIGRALFNEILPHTASNTITVHSSPYAVKIYKHFGFTATDTEQCENGIRYTPMIYYKLL